MAAADLTLRVGLRGLPPRQPQPFERTVQQIQHQQLPAQAGLAQQKLDRLSRLRRGGHTSREGQRALLVFLAVLGARVKLYQGVTLGALSVEKRMARTKRCLLYTSPSPRDS